MTTSTTTDTHQRSAIRHAVEEHHELILALFSGILILIAYAFEKLQIPATVYVTLYLSAYVIGGYAKAKEGLTETYQEKTLNVELLMILAAIGAAAIGYWMEGAILIFIFALSGALETYTMNKNERALQSLMSLQPEEATRLNADGKLEVIGIEQLSVGDIVYVRPGERIPVDGTIIRGQAAIEEASITGESIPVEKRTGDTVYNSTVNMNGVLTIEMTKAADESLFQKIIHMVQNAQSEQSPSAQFIERFESRYVKVVLVVVTLMMILPPYLVGWSFETSIYRAMILLVVASPCALVASITPAALSAIAASARNGVLFKGGAHIETLGQVNTIVFDKTGTLTTGKPIVTESHYAEDANQFLIKQAVASIEAQSNHPLAQAIVDHLQIETQEPSAFKDVTGYGIEATVSGVTYRIGKYGFHEGLNDPFRSMEQTLKEKGNTMVYVSNGESIVALYALRDTIRPEAKAAITSLNSLGITTIMLTGDNPVTAAAIAEEAGFTSFVAECLPEDKVNYIKQYQADGQTVAMVGDGINDAPALALAHVGIAMGEGTDAALETADVVLMKNDLGRLAYAVNKARKMNRIVKQNITLAIGVILILIVSNLSQFLIMPFAVVGHEGSTILVILNSLRLLQKDAPSPIEMTTRLKKVAA
ncbi:heavy metal translocating P-type ATPase [Exiguobacterium oxidotolerans]|uniref:heavy metal translocating P-type ATPase n=1 Tax=Exiguobacterium oxidotolerans TaxID=223958 RepID=UPI0006910BC9|nr:heavy metal translocating P-type ATPase [Exiguobacterium oxidotolerans]